MSRRWIGRALDVLAVAVILVALALFGLRFFIAPRLALAPPRPAPPVALDGVPGTPRFELAQHRGRVVFLDFWASWCEPCKASIPLVQHFARQHPDVDVVSIDVGEPGAVAAAFAREHAMRDVVIDPEQTAARAYGVFSFPTMIVVDASGLQRGTWVGFNPAIEYAMADAAGKYAKRREGALLRLRERRSS